MKYEGIFAGVLVGGRGRRLGGVDKAHLPTPHGTTFVQALLARVAPCVDGIVLAGRPEQAVDYPNAHFVIDSHTHAGPLAGLHALLTAAPKPWCWLMAVDMPTLGCDLLATLARARPQACPWETATPRIVVPYSPAGVEPCAALYHCSLLAAVQSQLSRGPHALRQLIRQTPHVRVAATLQQVRNVNHWSDMAASFDA